jgi:hypothetical protein
MSWAMFSNLLEEVTRYTHGGQEREQMWHRVRQTIKGVRRLEGRHTECGYGVVNLLMIHFILNVGALPEGSIDDILEKFTELRADMPVDTSLLLFDETVLGYAVRHLDAKNVEQVVDSWRRLDGYIDPDILFKAAEYQDSLDVLEVLWKKGIRAGAARAATSSKENVREWFSRHNIYTPEDRGVKRCRE